MLLLILFLPSFSRPVATAAVADGKTAVHAGKIASEVARNVATGIAKAPLACEREPGRRSGETPVGDPTQIHAPAQDLEAGEDAIAANGPKTEYGTAAATGVDPVCAAEPFMRREVALVSGYGGEDK